MSSIRRGLTLVELLVVIVILMMITAIAIPVLSPNVEQKRIREAARLVSGFLTGAKTRAQATGRPVGVLFERLPGNLNASMTLSYVEVPPPYSGDLLGSVASPFLDANDSDALKVSMDPTNKSDFNPEMVSVGDVIYFEGRANGYRIDGPATSPTNAVIAPNTKVLSISPAFSDGRYPWVQSPDDGFSDMYNPPPSKPRRGLPRLNYKIARQPVKSAGVPVQLPDGAVVDLSTSGFGASGLFATSLPANPTDTTPLNISSTERLVVMFGPSGIVSSIQLGGASTPASGGIHFMIGRPDGVNTVTTPVAAPTVANLADLNSLWVSVNPQTGMVSTAENGKYQGSNNPISDARAIAVTSQSMGSR